MPMTSRANAWPMTANWRRCSGRHSALAPMSRKTSGDGAAGMMEQMAGRLTPGMRCTYSRLAATTAPVLPALTKASALPSWTSFMPTTSDDSVFLRAAATGSSWKLITSGACDDLDVARVRRQQPPHARLVADQHHVDALVRPPRARP